MKDIKFTPPKDPRAGFDKTYHGKPIRPALKSGGILKGAGAGGGMGRINKARAARGR